MVYCLSGSMYLAVIACRQLSCTVFLVLTGEVSAEERHRTCVRDEDIT